MKLMALGDISFSRKLKDIQVEKIQDEIFEITKKADVLFGNLETPLTNSNKKETSHYAKILETEGRVHLKSSTSKIKILEKFGFDVLSIANNHILDYKERGLEDTMSTLENSSIKYVGAGKNLRESRTPKFVRVGNRKLGFLA